MMGTRWTISAIISAQSDLHIGASGEAVFCDGNVQRRFAAIVRGIDGKPYIPASTIKGVLRHLLDKDIVDRTLGRVPDSRVGDNGTMARLWLRNAFLTKAGKEDTSGLSRHAASKHTYLRNGVALDPASQAAEENKLYTREMIPEKAEFQLDCVWFGEIEDPEFLSVLATLNHGIQAGAGTSSGNGRVKLCLDTLSAEESGVAPDGSTICIPLSKGALASLRLQVVGTTPRFRKAWKAFDLTLCCQGPYLSIRGQQSGDDGRKVVEPLQKSGKPVLWRESLKGALRTRARWIAELQRARSGEAASRPDDMPMDDRSLEVVLGGRRSPKVTDLKQLSAVERLFGVTGLRSKLEVTSLDCRGTPDTQTITSTSLDRISGGGRDGFLFTERVFWQPVFEAEIHVLDDLEPDEEQLLSDLQQSLELDGLELGHGAAKGFGWFDVTWEARSKGPST